MQTAPGLACVVELAGWEWDEHTLSVVSDAVCDLPHLTLVVAVSGYNDKNELVYWWLGDNRLATLCSQAHTCGM